jgi:hypothetical protein
MERSDVAVRTFEPGHSKLIRAVVIMPSFPLTSPIRDAGSCRLGYLNLFRLKLRTACRKPPARLLSGESEPMSFRASD